MIKSKYCGFDFYMASNFAYLSNVQFYRCVIQWVNFLYFPLMIKNCTWLISLYSKFFLMLMIANIRIQRNILKPRYCNVKSINIYQHDKDQIVTKYLITQYIYYNNYEYALYNRLCLLYNHVSPCMYMWLRPGFYTQFRSFQCGLFRKLNMSSSERTPASVFKINFTQVLKVFIL